MSSYEAEDITEEDFYELSQSSHLSQFTFSQEAASDPNYENDSDYLPESEDESSQEFSQVPMRLLSMGSGFSFYYHYQQLIILLVCLLFFGGIYKYGNLNFRKIKFKITGESQG